MENEHTTTPAPTGGRPAVLAVVQHRRKVGSDLYFGASFTVAAVLVVVAVNTDLPVGWPWWASTGFGLLLSFVGTLTGYMYGRIKDIHRDIQRILNGGDR